MKPVIDRPLIVSLRLDDGLFDAVDAMRRQHFPPTRNVLRAHVTLFHHLPGEHHVDAARDLAAACATFGAVELSVPSVRFLGGGVALDVQCAALGQLRGDLASRWQPWLTSQDRQAYRPHITVQNKVPPPLARTLYEQLRHGWTPLHGRAVGLFLWRYDGGPWSPAGYFPFAG